MKLMSKNVAYILYFSLFTLVLTLAAQISHAITIVPYGNVPTNIVAEETRSLYCLLTNTLNYDTALQIKTTNFPAHMSLVNHAEAGLDGYFPYLFGTVNGNQVCDLGPVLAIGETRIIKFSLNGPIGDNVSFTITYKDGTESATFNVVPVVLIILPPPPPVGMMAMAA